MHDELELDEDGRLRRKKRVLPDGGTMHVPMGFYDGRFHSYFSDGTVDHTSPNQPGYRFADVDDPGRARAQLAYDERNVRVSAQWKMRKGDQQPQDDARDTPPRTPSLDELQKASDDAYRVKVARLDYRNRRHTT